MIYAHHYRIVCLLCLTWLNLVLDNYFCVSFTFMSSLTTRAVIVSKRHSNDEFRRINPSLPLQNQAVDDGEQTKAIATIEGYLSQDEEMFLQQILCGVGFDFISSADDDAMNSRNTIVYKYKYVKASGMLKLMENEAYGDNRAPKWIPTQSGEEVSV